MNCKHRMFFLLLQCLSIKNKQTNNKKQKMQIADVMKQCGIGELNPYHCCWKSVCWACFSVAHLAPVLLLIRALHLKTSSSRRSRTPAMRCTHRDSPAVLWAKLAHSYSHLQPQHTAITGLLEGKSINHRELRQSSRRTWEGKTRNH